MDECLLSRHQRSNPVLQRTPNGPAELARRNHVNAKVAILVLTLLATNIAVAQGGDVDGYAKLRIALATKPDYNGYQVQIIEYALSKEAMRLWEEGKPLEAVNKMKELLAAYPLSILGNRMLGETYRNLIPNALDAKQKEQLTILSKAHLDRYEGLVKSIVRSSSCASPKDGCKVINISEENMVLWSMKLSKVGQSLEMVDGVPYDKVVGKAQDGTQVNLFFDVSLFFRQ